MGAKGSFNSSPEFPHTLQHKADAIWGPQPLPKLPWYYGSGVHIVLEGHA